MGTGLAGVAKHIFNLGGTGAAEYFTHFMAEGTATIKAYAVQLPKQKHFAGKK